MRNRRFSFATLLILSLCVPIAAASAAEAKKIRTVEGITEYRLDNGLQVLLFPDPSKPTVTVNLTIFVGSRHEGYGEAGMAHLLEHMLFKGTPTHPEVPKVLQSHGARFNGTTWLDRTNYYETLPANDENLEFAIRLEADRMVNSFIRASDLKSEMTVVRNEFERGENNPYSILGQRMMSAAFLWHNYGQSTIGNRADIERVPIANLKAFYKKHYRSDNAMLVVAGQFDPKKALELTTKHFGAIEKPKTVRKQTYTEEPAQDGERFVTLRRVGDVSVVGVLYHIPSGAHPDYAAIDVLESVMTLSPSGRMYKALVETKKASSVYGSAYALHDPGVLRFMGEVTKGNDPQIVLENMLDVAEALGTSEVSKDEVERAQASLLKQIELAAADSQRSAIQLSEWAAQGDWRLKFLYRDRVEKVTPEDVQAVAKKYLRRNNRTVGVFIPVEKPERIAVPQTPDLVEMIGDYKGREAVKVGEAFDVSPLNIESRTERFTLPSGVKAAFLEKETRAEAVSLRLTLRFGTLDSLAGMAKTADFLPHLMLRGTKNLTRQQIQDELNKHRARLSGSGSAGSVTFTIQAKRSNLPAILKLLQQVLREPTLPAEELELLRQAEVAGLEQSLTDPTSLAMRKVSKAVNPYDKGDPRYIESVEEELASTKAVTVEGARRLYENFLNSKNGELAVVGDFDSAQTRELMVELLKDWESPESYVRIPRDRGADAKAQTGTIKTPGKANATYFAGEVFPIRDDHPDYPALVLGNYILGAGSLSSRLGDRVRQKEGLSYSVGSMVRASSLDKRTTFSIYAIANPTNMPKAAKAINEEIARLLKDGVTDEELEQAKQGYLQQRKVSRTSDAQIGGLLASSITAERTMAFQQQFEDAVRAASAEQVRSVLRKYVAPKRLVIITAGDFPDVKDQE